MNEELVLFIDEQGKLGLNGDGGELQHAQLARAIRRHESRTAPVTRQPTDWEQCEYFDCF